MQEIWGHLCFFLPLTESTLCYVLWLWRYAFDSETVFGKHFEKKNYRTRMHCKPRFTTITQRPVGMHPPVEQRNRVSIWKQQQIQLAYLHSCKFCFRFLIASSTALSCAVVYQVGGIWVIVVILHQLQVNLQTFLVEPCGLVCDQATNLPPEPFPMIWLSWKLTHCYILEATAYFFQKGCTEVHTERVDLKEMREPDNGAPESWPRLQQRFAAQSNLVHCATEGNQRIKSLIPSLLVLGICCNAQLLQHRDICHKGVKAKAQGLYGYIVHQFSWNWQGFKSAWNIAKANAQAAYTFWSYTETVSFR